MAVPVAAIAYGVGSALSGIGQMAGSGGASSDMDYWRRNWWTRQQIKDMYDEYRQGKLDIHPLAALGIPSQHAPVTSVPRDKWGAAGEALKGMGQIFDAREQLKERKELHKAQVAEIQARTELIKAQMPGATGRPKRPEIPGNPSELYDSWTNKNLVTVQKRVQTAKGKDRAVAGEGAEEQWAEVRGEKYPTLKPTISQDMSEPAESDWFYQLTRMINKGIDLGQIALFANRRDVRDNVWRKRPIGRGERIGWEWRYNLKLQSYQLVPIGYEGHQEYVHARLWKKHKSFQKQYRQHNAGEWAFMEKVKRRPGQGKGYWKHGRWYPLG